MINKLPQQQKAFNEILDYCRIHGFNWKTHVRPINENNQIRGYCLLNEGKETIVKQITF